MWCRPEVGGRRDQPAKGEDCSAVGAEPAGAAPGPPQRDEGRGGHQQAETQHGVPVDRAALGGQAVEAASRQILIGEAAVSRDQPRIGAPREEHRNHAQCRSRQGDHGTAALGDLDRCRPALRRRHSADRGGGRQQDLRVAPVRPGPADSGEDELAVSGLGLRDSVEDHGHDEQRQTGSGRLRGVEVLHGLEHGTPQTSRGHDGGDAEHGDGQQQRLVEAGHDGGPSQGELHVAQDAGLRGAVGAAGLHHVRGHLPDTEVGKAYERR